MAIDNTHTILAKKQAGINRMSDRQKRVHTRMAKLVETSPECIDNAMRKVLQRLENTGSATREIYLEWYQILSTWPVDRIANMLREASPNTQQLRSCAPFDFRNL